MRDFILTLASLAVLASAAHADPAITTMASVMREAPNAKAHIVQSVPAHAVIDLSTCEKNWCYVSWRDLFGYLPVAAVLVRPYGPADAPPPPAAVGGGVGPFFGYGWYQRW
ncbi:MAG TPA: hypothetical protein VEK35_07880 [Roseiarcus sp.]|nr:hypothetical protein [Roseiarcus sp.]